MSKKTISSNVKIQLELEIGGVKHTARKPTIDDYLNYLNILVCEKDTDVKESLKAKIDFMISLFDGEVTYEAIDKEENAFYIADYLLSNFYKYINQFVPQDKSGN